MSKLPETGPSLRRIIEQQKRRATRNENASPYTRSGTSVTAEGRVEVTGQMQSWDYDGTSRTDLGTAGWMLGPDDGGASLLALNGIDVYADLAAKDVDILALIADLAATQATLDAQQATLATTVSTLATTVSGLATAQATLTAQQATLDAQQATLATTVSGLSTAQATLATAVANIAALVGAQVTGDAGNASVSGATITTTSSNQATVTIAVPVGYTRAAVLGASSMAIGTTSLGSTMLTSIAGEDGQQMNVYPDSGHVGNGSSGHARVFAVTPGGSFQVATKAAVASGTGTVIVTTSVVATFFRS